MGRSSDSKNGGVTIQDVAQRAGVAPSTVSFVLNQSHAVSKETRELVQEAANALNYTLRRKGRPRRGHDQGPAVRRKNLVGFIISFAKSALQAGGIYLDVMQAAEAALTKANKGMIVTNLANDVDVVEPRHLSRIDGALMILNKPSSVMDRIASRIPSVRLMGQPNLDAPWDHVTYNNARVGVLAAQYLLERGHRTCAFFNPHPGVDFVERENTFVDTIRSGGGVARVNASSLDLGLATDEMRQSLKALMLCEPRPTGLFVPAGHVALTVHPMLFSINLKPGVDVDVITCDNDEAVTRGLHPRPADIDLHSRWIAAAGVWQLLQRIETPELPRSRRLFDPTMIPANSPWPLR